MKLKQSFGKSFSKLFTIDQQEYVKQDIYYDLNTLSTNLSNDAQSTSDLLTSVLTTETHFFHQSRNFNFIAHIETLPGNDLSQTGTSKYFNVEDRRKWRYFNLFILTQRKIEFTRLSILGKCLAFNIRNWPFGIGNYQILRFSSLFVVYVFSHQQNR